MAGLYLAFAWVVVQVAATVFPALELPPEALTLVIVVVSVGFPVALVLSWAFDLTPETMRRAVETVAPGPAVEYDGNPGGLSGGSQAGPEERAPAQSSPAAAPPANTESI